MHSGLLTLVFLCASMQTAAAQLPRLAANDNRTPAGALRNGVLTLDLEITRGKWHPDGEKNPGVEAFAIAEVGKPAGVPAPLIRVPVGTVVRARIQNKVSESLVVFGLNNSHGRADSVRLAAGETREFSIKADKPGTYLYAAWRNFRPATPEIPASGNDLTTGGAFIVDEPGTARRDRVFVMNMVVDTALVPRQRGLTSIIATINGRAWPHTERITHNLGDTILWRVVNATKIPHPMHLHGFYFDVLARGAGEADTIYDAAAVRKVVTERMLPGSTMAMRWVPDRAGNWLFHCHLTAHTQLRAPLIGAVKASGNHAHDAMQHMSNLIMGVSVRGNVSADVAERARQRLVVTRGDSIAGEPTPRFNYSLNGVANTSAAGPVIVLKQNESAAITVVNQSPEPTAVHWHGIELESFNDGVAGFGGHGNRISPVIAPGDSFVARMTPPRAGTFIYHTHIDELRQQPAGLYGALLVVDPAKHDPSLEKTIVLGSAIGGEDEIVFNGLEHPDVQLEAGKTYRLRFVQIMVGRPAMYVALLDPQGNIVEWQAAAKDGADLPAHQARVQPARQSLSNGETFDALFTPRAAGTYKLEARSAAGVVFGGMTFTAR
jgi:FtsP/CotA-like multicopper oxidase with cupredoxin domain